MQLKAKNQQKHALLFSDRFSFLWRLCNKSTLKCSRCLPGWTEHASRCFFLSPIQRSWENARRECFSENGDLAVVLNEADQAFLTTLTYQFVKQNPQVDFYSAWIGLQDMVREGRYWWVNGNELNSKVVYWRHLEPNNAIASWDIEQSGQDCVAIVPPRDIGVKDWLKSWDDIVCVGNRHYICETQALILD
ncbi:galactose-specific lectin nattectin-like [Labrus mixtus]|uniref:galactose-specific lectin nattectin-like n=1 Tax=Labrus mixtus TaxID=508554 RepID=UPI0029C0A73D|nr:galactose-specific lectin nattectin-like [Labrus mixtus]